MTKEIPRTSRGMTTFLEMTRIKYIFGLLLALALTSCGCSSAKKGVVQYRAEVVAEYPHDPSSYTQGLFFHEGELYESVGQYNESAMRKMDLATGRSLRTVSLGAGVFAEGSVILDSTLYILTWQNGQVFLCDPVSFVVRERVAYPREGWGLTTDGEQLIASDGTDVLYFMDRDLKVRREVHVTRDGKKQPLLNELEYIDGKVWANVYTYDDILIINPDDGVVEGVVDCAGLLKPRDRDLRTDVLNGIAVHDGKVYVTGKYWKKLFEIQIKEK